MEPIKKARLCIYCKKPNKGAGLMPWGWGHTSSRARPIMNANKHNESNESERGAATSFAKPLGNSTWHVSEVLLITQRDWNALAAAETMMYSHRADRGREGKWNWENKRLADKVCKKGSVIISANVFGAVRGEPDTLISGGINLQAERAVQQYTSPGGMSPVFDKILWRDEQGLRAISLCAMWQLYWDWSCLSCVVKPPEGYH